MMTRDDLGDSTVIFATEEEFEELVRQSARDVSSAFLEAIRDTLIAGGASPWVATLDAARIGILAADYLEETNKGE